jgi:hypothetical protein
MTDQQAESGTRLHYEVCDWCGGVGYFSVPDNGTNNGEETCIDCFGEGRKLVDQFGEPAP